MISASRLQGDAARHIVKLDSGVTFLLYFRTRCGTSYGPDAIHGVGGEQLVLTYAKALNTYFPMLMDKEFQWRFNRTEEVSVRVDILDLGPNLGGFANPTWCRKTKVPLTPYLALTCRPHAPSPEAVMRRCFATVAHELFHLLQFDTMGWQYWPKRSRIGIVGDPNWWLHEATAYAVEASLCKRAESGVDWYHLLWDWATKPERGINSDPCGLLAAPFVMYLAKRFGWGIVREIYEVTDDDVPSMLGSEIIGHVVFRYDQSPSPLEAFGSAFARYCVDAAMDGVDPSMQAIVGPRAVTEIYEEYSVDRTSAYSIESLGCRYFHLRPTKDRKWLNIAVWAAEEDLPRLRAELVLVSTEGERLESEPFMRNGSGYLGLTTNVLTRGSCEYGLLVVANCGERDSSRSADIRISIALV